MSGTIITAYLGQGLLAARPATPAVSAGCFALYYATDTSTWYGYFNGVWGTAGSGVSLDIKPFTTIPANPGFDPLFTGKASAVVLSSSNRVATPASSSPYNHMMGTPANYTGKRYFEFVPGGTGFTNLGFVGAASHLKNGDGNNLGAGNTAGAIGITSAGVVQVGEGTASFNLTTLATWTTSDVVSFALDLDAALFWIRTNAGNWNNNVSANPATGTLGQDLSWAWAGSASRLIWPAMNAGSTAAHTMRLKAADFTQSVPSGFAAWAT